MGFVSLGDTTGKGLKPHAILLDSEGHQLRNNGQELEEDPSFTHYVALGKYLGLTSPSALQANPSSLQGLLWGLKVPT